MKRFLSAIAIGAIIVLSSCEGPEYVTVGAESRHYYGRRPYYSPRPYYNPYYYRYSRPWGYPHHRGYYRHRH